MEKTFHLISVSLLIEQREQGDQLVAYDIVDHMLDAACAAEAARCQRAINVKSTVLESVRIVENDDVSARNPLQSRVKETSRDH